MTGIPTELVLFRLVGGIQVLCRRSASVSLEPAELRSCRPFIRLEVRRIRFGAPSFRGVFGIFISGEELSVDIRRGDVDKLRRRERSLKHLVLIVGNGATGKPKRLASEINQGVGSVLVSSIHKFRSLRIVDRSRHPAG